LTCGPTAWLLELDHEDAVAVARAAAELDGVAEVVPGAATVLATLAQGADGQYVGQQLLQVAGAPPPSPAADTLDTVELPVVYDGEDLTAVAAACGLSTAEVVDRHATTTYRAAFCGFAPGFAYLTGLDPALHLPRRGTPRTRVPAGSVAVAAEYTAVYPSASPGGWHLIGSTDTRLFDPRRDPPALIVPGAVVRFSPVRG
jgi:5-oxoprolinase (ATP-hydrolysing) subunit B